jgi:hypothetical protein
MLLLQIQRELKDKKGMNVITSIDKDDQTYKKVKKEYLRLSNIAKEQKLTNETKIFLLLTALGRDDFKFAQELFKMHQYKSMQEISARLALGRFYDKTKWPKKVIDYFLPLFEEQKLEERDIATLFKVLLKFAQHVDCDRVLGFALQKYPESLLWKIKALEYQIQISHIYPKNKEFIDNNLNYLRSRCETGSQHFFMGKSFFLAGYVNDGIKMFDSALKTLSPNPKKQEANALFIPEKCRQSMDEIIDILEMENIQPFPIAGSLLGLYRDGKFMDHDKDADIGIFVKDYQDVLTITSTICKKSKFVAPSMFNSPKESNLWNVAVFDQENNTAIDLFFFYRESEHIEYGVHTPSGILKWAFKPFDLVRQHLAGRDYWLPDDIEQHLIDLYDDWKTPVKVWDSLVNCPNILPSSRPVVLYFGLMRLYQSFDTNKFEKANNYYKQLTQKWGMHFSIEAHNNIENILKGVVSSPKL